MNCSPRNELMENFRKSIAITEDNMIINSLDIQKAFVDTKVDAEVADQVKMNIRDNMGDAYFKLMREMSKSDINEFIKLCDNAAKVIGGEPINVNPAPEEKPEEKATDEENPEVAKEGEEQQVQSPSSDVGISVNTSNES